MAKGDIGSVIDINQLITDGSGLVYRGNILLLSTGLVAIAMAGKDGDGYLQTFSVNASGVISDAIDSLEFETTVLASRPWLIHISGEVYAIAYEGTGNSGIVVTVTIDSGGNIGAAIIASYTFTAANCANPMIEHVSGTTYVIAYEENDVWPENATMDTLTINDDGTIPGAILDSWDFYATSYGYAPIVRHIANDVFAVAWKGGSGVGSVFLYTFIVSATGIITKAVIGGTFHASLSSTIGFDHIKGAIYGITCGAGAPTPYEPWIYTLNITDAGVVTDLDSLVLGTTTMVYSSFTVSTDASFIICAFTSSSYGLALYSILVSDLGALTLQDSLAATAGLSPAIVLVRPDFIIETGAETSSTSYVQTISIDVGDITIYPLSIDSVELFGSDLVGLSVVPAGITTVEVFGSDRIDQQVLPTGIVSSELVSPPLTGLRVDPTSISSDELFGTDRIDQQVLTTGIASLESVPSPLAGLKIEPSSVVTGESFGTSRLDQQLFASRITSSEAFGSEVVHRQITSIDVPTDGGTDSPVNWDTPTPTPGLPPVGWNDGGTTRSQSSTHRYSPTHKYKAHFMMEVVLGKAGGNMSSMDMETVITIGGEEYKAPTFRMEVYTE